MSSSWFSISELSKRTYKATSKGWLYFLIQIPLSCVATNRYLMNKFSTLISKTWVMALSLAVLSCALITREWYCLPADAPHTSYIGILYPASGPGWGTSFDTQFFLFEFSANLMARFLVSFGLIKLFEQFQFFQNLRQLKAKFAFGLAGALLLFWVISRIVFTNYWYLTRDYDMEIISTKIVCPLF